MPTNQIALRPELDFQCALLHTIVDYCVLYGYDQHVMADRVRTQVLMSREEAERFESYCRERGFKKSTLIARLVREHLSVERFRLQHELFKDSREGQEHQ